MKTTSSLAIAILLTSTTAYADSWCDYDSGRIGTKAIGYAPLFKLDGLEYDFENGICRLTVAVSPDPESETVTLPCEQFREMPSYRNPYNAGGFIESDRRYLASDYFTFLIFARENGMMAVELRSGERRWIGKFSKDEKKILNPPFLPWAEGQRIVGAKLYNSADFADIASELEFSGNIQRRFYEFVFQHSEEPEYKVERALRHEYVDGFYFGVNYRAVRQFIGSDGTQWIEAEEQLATNSIYFPLSAYHAFKSENLPPILRSDVIRTVFVPMIAPDGTVLAVVGSALGCD